MQARLRTTARLLRVIDGDTLLVRLICPCCRIESEQRVRLARIDAPELNGRNVGAAIAARDCLVAATVGGELEVCVTRAWPDRYGRVLAEVVCRSQNLSDWMIQQGHAKIYRGDVPPRLLVV